MTTSFSSLPILSLSILSSSSPTQDELFALAESLDEVLSTTGFAYLTDIPINYTHDDIFSLCDQFFGENGLSDDEKMRLAKKTFVQGNNNTYRGYFPPQPGADNLKEGFELGSSTFKPSRSSNPTGSKCNLTEPNVFPARPTFRSQCETLHTEMQALSARLLMLLALALRKPASFFDHYLTDSLSTLRLLHYPPIPSGRRQELICTPHTDSGILTLLHQDQTGGLEVRNGDGKWIAAPYVPGSIVMNIGDLMAQISGNRWIATYHRVRSAKREQDIMKGRYSVPFFFEPGLNCKVKSLDGDDVLYGQHVLSKMKSWVEFQDVVPNVPNVATNEGQAVEVF